jgi:hypothetical protein
MSDIMQQLIDERDALKAGNDRLKQELANWRDLSERVLAEKCAEDEKHCTCVIPLRAEISRLHRILEIWMYYTNRDVEWQVRKRLLDEKLINYLGEKI